MRGSRHQLDLADMADLPMSAGWYWYLAQQRGVLRRLQHLHRARLTSAERRDPASLTPDMIAQRDADAAVEAIDRYMRTMEAAGVLHANG